MGVYSAEFEFNINWVPSTFFTRVVGEIRPVTFAPLPLPKGCGPIFFLIGRVEQYISDLSLFPSPLSVSQYPHANRTTPHIMFKIIQQPFDAFPNDAMNHHHIITHIVATCHPSWHIASYLPATPGCKGKSIWP